MDEGTREERSSVTDEAQDPNAEVVTEQESSVETTRQREKKRKDDEVAAQEREEQAEAAQEEAQPDTRTPEEIREDIRQTRVELGDTAEALAAKSDVKAQAKAKVDDVKGKVSDKKDGFTAKAKNSSPEGAQQGAQQAVAKVKENPAPFVVGAAVLAGYLIGRWGS